METSGLWRLIFGLQHRRVSFREASKAQNPRRVLFKDSWKAQNLRKVSFRDALGSLGAENETWHSEHLGGLGSEIFQTGTKTYHLDHLGGLRRRMIQKGAKTDHMERGPKWSKIFPHALGVAFAPPLFYCLLLWPLLPRPCFCPLLWLRCPGLASCGLRLRRGFRAALASSRLLG